MDLDSVYSVESFSDLTLRVLIERLQKTLTPEQCIYRETELDEVWRLLDIACRFEGDDEPRDTARLAAMRTVVHQAHDLVGMDASPREAAAKLGELLAGQGAALAAIRQVG